MIVTGPAAMTAALPSPAGQAATAVTPREPGNAAPSASIADKHPARRMGRRDEDERRDTSARSDPPSTFDQLLVPAAPPPAPDVTESGHPVNAARPADDPPALALIDQLAQWLPLPGQATPPPPATADGLFQASARALPAPLPPAMAAAPAQATLAGAGTPAVAGSPAPALSAATWPAPDSATVAGWLAMVHGAADPAGSASTGGDVATTDPLSLASSPAPGNVLSLGGLGTTLPVAPPTSAAAMPPLPMSMPADPQTGFGDALGEQVLWVAEQRLGHAQIRISPEHLGPIDVSVKLDGTQVHAQFSSSQQDVRHALEASLPRLRDLLQQQGLQLGQADVGHRDAGQQGVAQQQAGHREDARTSFPGSDTVDALESPAATTHGLVRMTRGLLDEYA